MTKVEGIILNIIPADAPTAVHESSHQQPLEVYPNPVAEVLYIKNLPCEAVEYSIFNVLGQKVTSGSSKGSISVADLEKGLYLLQIKDEKSLETVKFVVK
jgi:hypothetical protein